MTPDNTAVYEKRTLKGTLTFSRTCKKCNRFRAAKQAAQAKARRRAIPNKGVRDFLDAMWDTLKREERRFPLRPRAQSIRPQRANARSGLGKVGPKATPTRPCRTGRR